MIRRSADFVNRAAHAPPCTVFDASTAKIIMHFNDIGIFFSEFLKKMFTFCCKDTMMKALEKGGRDYG